MPARIWPDDMWMEWDQSYISWCRRHRSQAVSYRMATESSAAGRRTHRIPGKKIADSSNNVSYGFHRKNSLLLREQKRMSNILLFCRWQRKRERVCIIYWYLQISLSMHIGFVWFLSHYIHDIFECLPIVHATLYPPDCCSHQFYRTDWDSTRCYVPTYGLQGWNTLILLFVHAIWCFVHFGFPYRSFWCIMIWYFLQSDNSVTFFFTLQSYPSPIINDSSKDITQTLYDTQHRHQHKMH